MPPVKKPIIHAAASLDGDNSIYHRMIPYFTKERHQNAIGIDRNSEQARQVIISKNTALLSHLKSVAAAAHTGLTLFNGSLRQTYPVDNSNARNHDTPLFVHTLQDIETHLVKSGSTAQLNRYSLADSYMKVAHGNTFEAAASADPSKMTHNNFAVDDTKITLLYAQLHKFVSGIIISKKNETQDSNDEFIFEFFDDRDDILTALKDFFTTYPHALPPNLTLNLYRYEQGLLKAPYATLKGNSESVLDYDYETTIHHLLGISPPDFSSYKRYTVEKDNAKKALDGRNERNKDRGPQIASAPASSAEKVVADVRTSTPLLPELVQILSHPTAPSPVPVLAVFPSKFVPPSHAIRPAPTKAKLIAQLPSAPDLVPNKDKKYENDVELVNRAMYNFSAERRDQTNRILRLTNTFIHSVPEDKYDNAIGYLLSVLSEDRNLSPEELRFLNAIDKKRDSFSNAAHFLSELKFQIAVMDLDNAIACDKSSLSILAKDVKNSAVKVNEKNSLSTSEKDTLTDVLNKTSKCLTKKGENSFVELAQVTNNKTFENLTKRSWGKFLLGSTLALLGAIIITASVLVAVQSAGVAAPLSAIGINIGVSLVSTGIAAACAVAGTGVVASGLFTFRPAPLKEAVYEVVAQCPRPVPAHSTPILIT